jgi:hypothetical protein
VDIEHDVPPSFDLKVPPLNKNDDPVISNISEPVVARILSASCIDVSFDNVGLKHKNSPDVEFGPIDKTKDFMPVPKFETLQLNEESDDHLL